MKSVAWDQGKKTECVFLRFKWNSPKWKRLKIFMVKTKRDGFSPSEAILDGHEFRG